MPHVFRNSLSIINHDRCRDYPKTLVRVLYSREKRRSSHSLGLALVWCRWEAKRGLRPLVVDLVGRILIACRYIEVFVRSDRKLQTEVEGMISPLSGIKECSKIQSNNLRSRYGEYRQPVWAPF